MLPTPGLSRWTVAALALAGGLLLLPRMGSLPLLDADEPRFAECSRQMLVTGDWMYPQFNGQPRHQKPPFFNWVQASIYAIAGVSEFTARLPSVLATVGTGLLLYWFAAGWRGRRTGLLVMVVWFTLPQSVFWARMSVVDPLLTLIVSAALVTAFRGVESSGTARWNWYLPCGLAMGLATLTKGPVGIVIPALGYLLYVLFSGQARRGLWHPGPWVALLIALITAGPWFAAQVMQYGHSYVDRFFGFDNVQRYTKARDTLGPIGWTWVLPVVLVFAFPSSILLPRGLGRVFRELRPARSGEPAARWRLFAGLWLLAVACLFAPTATRLPQYFMALYPAAALLVGSLLGELLPGSPVPGRRWPVALGFLSAGLLLGGGFGYGASLAGHWAPKLHLDNVPLMTAIAAVLGGAFALGGIVTAVAWGRGNGRAAVGAVLAMGLLTGLVMSDVVWPTVGITRDQGIKELGLICRAGLAPDAPVISYEPHTSSIVFYSRHVCLAVKENRTDQALNLLRTHPGAWLLIHKSFLSSFPQREVEVVAARRQYVLVRLRETMIAGRGHQLA